MAPLVGTGLAAPAGEPPAAAAATPAADEVVTQCAVALRQTLAIQGRAPLDFAGLTVYAILQDLAALLTRCLAHRQDARLAIMQQAVQAAVQSYAAEREIIQQGAQWVHEIRQILAAPLPTAAEPGPGSAQVAQQLQDYLDRLAAAEDLTAPAQSLLHHIQGVTARYAPGLFHCYDIQGLPRTNNELEGDFRALKRRERRITGCAQTRQRLMRHGAWLPLRACTLSEVELRQRLAAVPTAAYWQERARLDRRLDQRRRRYRLRHDRDQLFGQIEQQWRALPSE
ncbi:MAG: hypothetical protein KJ734_02910 [Chloroflexi bacterium]|nr:hypothetical protein [Chloroflexota bacterium]